MEAVTDPTPQNPGEEAMLRAGEPLTDKVQEDYFGFDETHRVMLPDGVSYVEHQSLNEGAKRRYLNQTNREITIRRQTQDASVKMAPGDERHSLLTAAITGWNLRKGGVEAPFSPRSLDEWLEKANPKIIDIIEKDVRLHNPWLLQEMTVEDIDKEIADLKDMRERKLEEEASGNGSTAS